MDLIKQEFFDKTFVIGDIHGCHDLLVRLIDKIRWEPEWHRLIFLGDYIDRGKDPKGVVDYILELSRYGTVDCLLGNHESLFLNYLSTGDPRLCLANGGLTTLNSYNIKGFVPSELMIPPEHLEFYRRLKLYVELEDFLIVHAGLRPGVHFNDQNPEDLLWIREKFIYSDYDFGKTIIFGHTPFHEPYVTANKIGLDTGAVYGNKLTCLEMPSMELISVEA